MCSSTSIYAVLKKIGRWTASYPGLDSGRKTPAFHASSTGFVENLKVFLCKGTCANWILNDLSALNKMKSIIQMKGYTMHIGTHAQWPHPENNCYLARAQCLVYWIQRICTNVTTRRSRERALRSVGKKTLPPGFWKFKLQNVFVYSTYINQST